MLHNELQLIATETGEEIWMVQQAHSKGINRCRFSLDGSRVVTISAECHKVGALALYHL